MTYVPRRGPGKPLPRHLLGAASGPAGQGNQQLGPRQPLEQRPGPKRPQKQLGAQTWWIAGTQITGGHKWCLEEGGWEDRKGSSPVTACTQEHRPQQPAQEVACALQWDFPAVPTHEVPLRGHLPPETRSPETSPHLLAPQTRRCRGLRTLAGVNSGGHLSLVGFTGLGTPR